MSSNLESEDLDNVPLVRMEDVQPARDRHCEVYSEDGEDMETCLVDDLEYDNEYIVDNDEDSNIGSMVSIHSEEVQEDSDSAEVIVPEVLDEKNKRIKSITTGYKYKEIITENNPESWPTLEILPGGVIKHSEKCEENLPAPYPDENSLSSESNMDNMYACAKCSQTFKFLFCLVKHVRWHEIEKKRQQEVTDIAPKYVCLHSVKCKGITKTQKRIPKKAKS